MNSLRSLTLCTSLLTAPLLACGGSDVATVRLGLTGEGGQPAGRDARGAMIKLESARAYVRHIELDLPSGAPCDPSGFDDQGGRLSLSCDDDPTDDSHHLRINGPFVVDLVSGEASPAMPELVLPAGNYRRVDVRFDDAEASEGVVPSGDELADRTIVAAGRLEDDSAFDLRLRFNEDARFERAGGVEVPESVGQLLLWLDVGQWFAGLPIDGCRDDGHLDVRDGRLQLEDGRGSCSDVENHLKERIKTSGQLDRED